MTQYKCDECLDTGHKLMESGAHSDYLDCSCEVAQERIAIEREALSFAIDYKGSLEQLPFDLRWHFHQRARKIEQEAHASRIADLERQLAEASAPAVEQPLFKAESIDGLEFRKLADAYHCVNEQDEVEPTYDAMVYFIDAEIERQVKAALAAPQAADTDKVREAILGLTLDIEPTIFASWTRAKQDAYCNGFHHAQQAASELLPVMAAQAPVREVPGWISVDERLPEYGAEVLVFQPEKERKVTALARFTSNVWDYYWDAAHIGKGRMTRPASVTHWMSLPAAPVPQDTDKEQA